MSENYEICPYCGAQYLIVSPDQYCETCYMKEGEDDE
jgi:hypothetical protein